MVDDGHVVSTVRTLLSFPFFKQLQPLSNTILSSTTDDLSSVRYAELAIDTYTYHICIATGIQTRHHTSRGTRKLDTVTM